MKAGAVAAPFAAGLMMSAATSASAAESVPQPAPQAQPSKSGYPQPGYPVPQEKIAADLAAQNGFNTGTDTKHFTFTPGSANAPRVSSPTANLNVDCANAAQSGTPCQISDAQFNPDHSFQMIQEGEHYGPSVTKATESSMTTHAVKHPTLTQTDKVSEQIGVKAGAKGKAGVPLVAEGEVSSELSSTTGYEHTWQHNPEEITDTKQKQTGLEFNPSLSPSGAHVEQRDLTAAYTGGNVSVNNGPILDGNGQPYRGSNGQPINDIVEIDDSAEYQRTLNKPTTFIAENAPPAQQSAPVTSENNQQQPPQQAQPQALPSSYWAKPGPESGHALEMAGWQADHPEPQQPTATWEHFIPGWNMYANVRDANQYQQQHTEWQNQWNQALQQFVRNDNTQGQAAAPAETAPMGQQVQQQPVESAQASPAPAVDQAAYSGDSYNG